MALMPDFPRMVGHGIAPTNLGLLDSSGSPRACARGSALSRRAVDWIPPAVLAAMGDTRRA